MRFGCIPEVERAEGARCRLAEEEGQVSYVPPQKFFDHVVFFQQHLDQERDKLQTQRARLHQAMQQLQLVGAAVGEMEDDLQNKQRVVEVAKEKANSIGERVRRAPAVCGHMRAQTKGLAVRFNVLGNYMRCIGEADDVIAK